MSGGSEIRSAFDATISQYRTVSKPPPRNDKAILERCRSERYCSGRNFPACAEAGILGALTGVLGSMMALEVIRAIVGFGTPLVGRYLMFDARDMRVETIGYGWDPNNPLSGENPTIRDLSGHLRPSS